VLLFVGRLHVDKGLLDLAQAFVELRSRRNDVQMMIVGPDEGGVAEKMRDICAEHLRYMHFVNFTESPEKYMAASDVFCLPSYREGFGSVIIEAASVGLPAVASKIYGIVDAIEEGRNGLLFEAGNIRSLTGAIVELLKDPQKMRLMGDYARQRAKKDFSKEMMIRAVEDFYSGLLFEAEASSVP
jgi:glycosyltransferase involved in cell wall biosynthesis